jgi:multidrug efflux pump
VRIFGERQVSMRINLDRTRLAGYKLTVQDVEDAIRRQNAEIPAGRIESSTASSRSLPKRTCRRRSSSTASS